jgi:hypothetical protein
MTETEFAEKLARFEAKRNAPYKVPKSKMNGRLGAPGSGKRLPPDEFDRYQARNRAAFRWYARENMTIMTPQERRERQAKVEAFLAAKKASGQ